MEKPDNVRQKPRGTAKAGPGDVNVVKKQGNMKTRKVGAPTIKAPGTEEMVETYNPHNNLRVLTANPPTYRNYVQDGNTDV